MGTLDGIKVLDLTSMVSGPVAAMMLADQSAMDLVFEAQDGYLTAGAISNSEWEGMCQALNREELIEDERFATPMARGRNADLRKQIVADEIAKWRRDEILARLVGHSREILAELG